MKVEPIVTKKVYQEIISQFVEMIRSGQIRKGEKLPSERILAEMFKVSRPSVREAFRVLETIGLVEIKPGGGAYVVELNLAPLINTFAPLITMHEGYELELLDLRELLEVKAVEQASGFLSGEMIQELKKILVSMKKALDRRDLEESALCDIQFHRMIFDCSGNFIIQQASEYVNSLIEISIKWNRSFLLRGDKNGTTLYKEHEAIFHAIEAGDGILAGREMANHIKRVRTLYLKNGATEEPYKDRLE